MQFNSFKYAAFFLIVWVTVAFVLRPRTVRKVLPNVPRYRVLSVRNAFLLLASYVFYGSWDIRFLGLIMLTTVNDYLVGRGMDRERDPRRRRYYVTWSIVVNLGVLGFFKYYDFFAQSLEALLGRAGFEANFTLLRVLLPVGISFYVFQSVAYAIEVYRGNLRAETSLLRLAAYIAFFPQLVAGPIERPGALMPQFRHVRPVTWHKVSSGAYLIAVGLFKKVVIADTVAKVADAAFALKDPTGLQVLLGTYAFAFQIYSDFSAYSDIARGSARCLGFELSRNFDMPYFSVSPSEFWRRWHISLSTWLRDYLYIPLGGNRKGPARTYLNLMLTMVLGGLWHGSAWTYVVWGAIHGAILCVYRVGEDSVKSWAATLPVPTRGALRVAAGVLFFHLVCLTWLFFRAENIEQAFRFLSALFNEPTRNVAKALRALGPVRLSACLVAALTGVQLVQYLRRDSWAVFHAPAFVRGTVYAVALVLFVWVGEDGGESFIYFQF